ncbi:MAG: aminoacyl-tRNA hydrolase [Bacilli bacterium]|nr:aminoacyl-tRNA hydrolase [Bacilli bacterium]
MKLIVGLGNPGKEYENTRHNIGFMTIEKCMKKYSFSLNKTKFNGNYGETIINNEKYMFLCPQKYMNLSGEVVSEFVNYFKISIEDILIISDDLDMPTGKVKLKPSGSSGGHNGLKNIELHLGTSNFKRLKIGIANNKLIDTKDYVLGHFSKEEKEVIDISISKALDAIFDFSNMTFDKLMSKYNSGS